MTTRCSKLPEAAVAGLAWLIGAAAAAPSHAEESAPPKAPVPPSPFLPVVYRYADTMLAKGRDEHGAVKTGLFLGALDRSSLGLLAARPRAPGGMKEEDRPGGATGPAAWASPQHDQNLLRVLYTLSELSAKAAYREAADGEVRRLFEDAAAPGNILPWGPWTAWDVLRDAPVLEGGADGARAPFRPWLLWDRAFDLAPEACSRWARGLPGETAAVRSVREAGFRIRAHAVAHARTGDARHLEAIETLLGAVEANRILPGELRAEGLSLAIDCDGAAHRVPGPLAARLRAVAAREDGIFCGLPHDVAATGGFLTSGGRPFARGPRTALWEARGGIPTTAQLALLCVSRLENTGKVAYRELVHAAAEVYLGSLPPDGADTWPGTFGHAISLELAAWRSTARQVYLDRARKLGDLAIERFFDGSPLPRASLKSDHYESLTGADTLALALVELHLHILHITAVRCPPSSADR